MSDNSIQFGLKTNRSIGEAPRNTQHLDKTFLAVEHAGNIMLWVLISLTSNGGRERDPRRNPAAERNTGSDRKSTSGRGTEPRRRWSGFKFGCPGMARPQFELALHNKL